MRISILGSGSWGVTLANLLSKKGHQVMIWGRNNQVLDRINKEKEIFFDDKCIVLEKSIKASKNLDEVLNKSELCLVALPAKSIETVFKAFRFKIQLPLIILSKGFVNNNAEFIYEFLEKTYGFRDVFVLSGPNLALEIIEGKPSCSVLAGKNIKQLERFQAVLSSSSFRIYTSLNLRGVSLGGILKNVYAISAGLCDALDLGMNAKTALLTRALVEMRLFYDVFDASVDSLNGLSGLGDLMATAFSDLSRNYRYGYAIAQNKKRAQEFNKTKTVEGINTVLFLHKLVEKHTLNCPILEALYQVINQQAEPRDLIEILMLRDLKTETN